MIMMSPEEGRKTLDIQATVLRQPDLVPKILDLHALTGCDTVPASYGVGKPTALKAAANHSFSKRDHTHSTVEELLPESTNFMVSGYGSKLCRSMTKRRQRMWSLKTGNKPSWAPRLKTLPPTTEAFLTNIQRAHFQVTHWYSALEIGPPDFDPLEHRFEADQTNKALNPRPLPEAVNPAPEFVLKLILSILQSGTLWMCKTPNAMYDVLCLHGQ